MAREPKMKIGIGADTGDFEKGARRVKQEMKDLNKVSSDAFSAMGSALGIDTRQVQQFSSAIAGLGNKLQQTGTEGTKAFGDILKSIAPIGGAIAGIGLAAAMIAFKSLKDEAESFKNTIEGANIEMATAAYVTTYKQVLHDYRRGVGEVAAELESAGKKAAGTFWTNFAAFSRAARQTSLDLPGANTPVLDETWKNIGDATVKARRSEEIARRVSEITQEQIKNEVEVERLVAQIAEYRRIAREESSTLAQKTEALQKAEEAIRQKYALQKPLLEELAALYTERNSLSSTSLEEQRQEIDAKKTVLALSSAESTELKSLYRDQRSVTAETGREAAEREKARKEMEAQAAVAKAIADSRASLKEWSAAAGANTPGAITTQATVQVPTTLAVPNNVEEWRWDVVASIGDIHVGIKFDVDTAKVQDITREVESAMQGLATSVGEVLGQLAGDLATGGDAWGNFSNAALSAFGDMATAIGNIAIQTGIASLGIEAALKELGGAGAALAISAGVALVALGAAVKAGLSNVAAGNYSAGAGVATASYSSYNSDYETREVNVNVTGTLQADGNQLVAVINNTNKNNYYTT